MIIVDIYLAIMFVFFAICVWQLIALKIRTRHISLLLRGGYEYWQLYKIYHRLAQYQARHGKKAAKRWRKSIIHDCKK